MVLGIFPFFQCALQIFVKAKIPVVPPEGIPLQHTPPPCLNRLQWTPQLKWTYCIMLYLNNIVQDHTYIRHIYTFFFSKYQTEHAFQPCLILLNLTFFNSVLQRADSVRTAPSTGLAYVLHRLQRFRTAMAVAVSS